MGTHFSKDHQVEIFERKQSLGKQFRKSFKNKKSERNAGKKKDTLNKTSMQTTKGLVNELETEASDESNNTKDEEIGLIVAELVLSTYGRKNRSRKKLLSDVCPENMDFKDDILISLDDSKDIKERRNKEMVTSLTILDIEDASDSQTETDKDSNTDTDMDIDTDTDSASNDNKNVLIMNSIEQRSDKTDESEKEDVQGLFPAVTTDEVTEQINQQEILPGYCDIQEYENYTDKLTIDNNKLGLSCAKLRPD